MNNSKNKKIYGIIGLLLTPFKDNNEVDFNQLKQLVNFMIKNGIKNIAPTTSTGEFASLTLEEYKTIIKLSFETAKNRAKIIPGISHTSQKVIFELIDFVKDAGIDTVMILPPYYYNGLTDEIIFEWYKALNNKDINIIIYNNPALIQFNMLPTTIPKYVELENVIGIKESHFNITQFSQTLRLVGDKISVIYGPGDYNAYEIMLLGGESFFSGLVNFVPKLMLNYYHNLKNNNIPEAKRINNLIKKFNDLCLYKGAIHEIAVYKSALEYFGFGNANARLPIKSLNSVKKNELKDVLKILEKEEAKL
ncbi:MAG: dihydrodipicolinate synthase family protein [Atribacterota bacterium]|nr:dihydrodipicolinate synthase family protein [Atribacterota bacterium]